MAHRNAGQGGKTPFGVKFIIGLLVVVTVVILAYAWGSH